MANTPQVTPSLVTAANAFQNDRPAVPDPKTNWLKDLVFPIILLVGGAILGLAVDEYKINSNTPKLRYAEVAQLESGTGGRYRQKISTTFHAVGRPAISSLIISASALNPSVHIIDEQLMLEPEGQEPQPLQEEIGGNPDAIRGLGFVNFHAPQRVRWSIVAETRSLPADPIVRFNYRGVNDIRDEKDLTWDDGLPLLGILLALIAYSIAATAFAIYFRLNRR